jgi:glycerol 3-phosphatase-2
VTLSSQSSPTQDPLAGCDGPLAKAFDVALLDLDGVVYRGEQPVATASEALAQARQLGMRLAFVTNNALRPPQEVAARIQAAGVEADPADVVTSAQAAARLLAEQLPSGSRVLIAGGAGLRLAVTERGLVPVSSADDDPAAVVSGYDPELNYARLAEAVLAVSHGALWVASNTDATVPTERGLLPGNGALVSFIATATKATPQVAGKPELALHRETIDRTHAERPLVVGDRLDTDIEGANRAGAPSLLVLTGVATLEDLIGAQAQYRPTYLAEDLRGLLRGASAVHLDEEGESASCGGWSCSQTTDGRLEWAGKKGGDNRDGADDGLDAYRAGVRLHWALADDGRAPKGTRGQVPTGCEAFTAFFA